MERDNSTKYDLVLVNPKIAASDLPAFNYEGLHEANRKARLECLTKVMTHILKKSPTQEDFKECSIVSISMCKDALFYKNECIGHLVIRLFENHSNKLNDTTNKFNDPKAIIEFTPTPNFAKYSNFV